MERFHAFGQCLSRCPGSWTHIRSSLHGVDSKVLCLRWLVPGARWCDIPGYLAFLDSRSHRQILRCFVSQSPKQSWSLSELAQLVEPDLALADLEAALAFCETQEFLVEYGGTWQPGPRMYHVRNLGATLEWAVMEHLQHFHQANARRGVLLKELQEQGLGDLDVLAFTESGLVVTVECKSSTSGITDQHVNRYLRRAALFPVDIALLLIDTSDEQQLKARLTQITLCLGSGVQHQDLPICYAEAGSQVYHIQENIYLGNTGGGIGATLKAVMHLGASQLRPAGRFAAHPLEIAVKNRAKPLNRKVFESLPYSSRCLAHQTGPPGNEEWRKVPVFFRIHLKPKNNGTRYWQFTSTITEFEF